MFEDLTNSPFPPLQNPLDSRDSRDFTFTLIKDLRSKIKKLWIAKNVWALRFGALLQLGFFSIYSCFVSLKVSFSKDTILK